MTDVKVLVSDTSVLIDLERGSLLETSFALPFEFAVPDLLYVQELAEHGGAALIRLGLRVEELDGDGVSLALRYRQAARSLSLPDSFALALAQINCWTLLSGDGGLRRLALSEGVSCHGVLWLIDRMFDCGRVSGHGLAASLEAIVAHPRCRLPMQEVNMRIRRFTEA